jgi:hypothetical protein
MHRTSAYSGLQFARISAAESFRYDAPRWRPSPPGRSLAARPRRRRTWSAVRTSLPFITLGYTDGWLCPLPLEQGRASDVRQGLTSTTPWRASDRWILPMGLDAYLELLDWSGRLVRTGKRGSIPSHQAPILTRLGIKADCWSEIVARFDQWFGHVVGRASRVIERARQAGRRYYRGQSHCAMAFG